jgi:phenylalanyl-tRNA synthetase alpha chain
MKWIDEYFPFTDPSLELEIFFNDDWVEVLGSGVILDGVMLNANRNIEKEVGWAFGLGLERWAMKLFEISDIRLFWS